MRLGKGAAGNLYRILQELGAFARDALAKLGPAERSVRLIAR